MRLVFKAEYLLSKKLRKRKINRPHFWMKPISDKIYFSEV